MRRLRILLFSSLLLLIFGYLAIRNYETVPNILPTPSAESEDHQAELQKRDFQLLRSGKTGVIPKDAGEFELMVSAQMNARARLMDPLTNIQYSFQGPSNLAGRIRALCFDKNDVSGNILMVGGVSGGLFRSINGGSSWTKINLPGQRHYTISAIAQDPRIGFGNNWYCAGGAEIYGGSQVYNTGAAGHFGEGLFKSVDNGNSWFKLESSNTGLYNQFDRVTDNIHSIVVNHLNGDVYAACGGAIVKSTDGGNTWTEVFSDNNPTLGITNAADVCITASGKIFAGFGVWSPVEARGIWLSLTGEAGSWTRIAENNNPVDIQFASRIRLALDSDQENLLILYSNTNAMNGCEPRTNLFRYNISQDNFTQILLPDCNSSQASQFNAQGGYNLCIYASPQDPNTIFVGGTNLYRSVNGGDDWTQIGGYDAQTNPDYNDSHPDVHYICFSPANNNILFCADDGGVRKGDISVEMVDWISLNNSLPTFQYYHVAINPDIGVDHFIGGAQDNGTTSSFNSGSLHNRIFPGDGVSVGIGKGPAPYKEYVGLQYGFMVRRNSSLESGGGEVILNPPGIQSPFITIFHLDPDNTDYLYYGGRVPSPGFFAKVLRLRDASVTNFPSWEMFDFDFWGNVNVFAPTRGIYNPASSKLFMGTSYGRIYRINDPMNAALNSIPVNITPPGTDNESCLGLSVNPLNDNELIAAYSNYDMVSIWHTQNATSNNPVWTNIEGNLALPSIRTCQIVIINNEPHYFVGTSIGLFRTGQLNGSSTIWNQEALDIIGNALVVDLAYRPQDNVLIIGTHGSGMYKALLNGASLPISLQSFKGIPDNNTNRLYWTTNQEQNNKGFDIEYSTDGNNFYPIGFVPGKGLSFFPVSYQFVHHNIVAPVNYYRLKQIDFDGSFSYSKTIVLKHRSSLLVQLLENPAKSTIYANIRGAERLSVVVQLYNMSGISMLTKQIAQVNGRVEIPIPNLPPGQYICVWRFSNTVVINNKIIISK